MILYPKQSFTEVFFFFNLTFLQIVYSDDERDEFPSLRSSCQTLHLLPVAASSMGLVGIGHSEPAPISASSGMDDM